MKNTNPGQHRVREIAVLACADPRTIRKFLAGGRVYSTVATRIERAVRELALRDVEVPAARKVRGR